MRSLDLFAGAAGAWTLGFARAGIDTVAACEADPWRRGAYLANWPDVEMFEDVRTLTADAFRGLGPIDVVCGSPPCQDASRANAARTGLDGERTGLFFEAVRIVSELRPLWVAFENVPGLADGGIDRLLGGLGEAGYPRERVGVLDMGAEDVGAACIRRRLFVVGRRGDAAEPAQEPGRDAGQPRPGASAAAGADGGALRLEPGRGGEGRAAAGHGRGAGRPKIGLFGRRAGPMARRARALDPDSWPQATHWGDRYADAACGHLRVAVGLPPGMAGQIAQAYGDAIPWLQAQLIGEFIVAYEAGCLP